MNAGCITWDFTWKMSNLLPTMRRGTGKGLMSSLSCWKEIVSCNRLKHAISGFIYSNYVTLSHRIVFVEDSWDSLFAGSGFSCLLEGGTHFFHLTSSWIQQPLHGLPQSIGFRQIQNKYYRQRTVKTSTIDLNLWHLEHVWTCFNMNKNSDISEIKVWIVRLKEVTITFFI